jgi:hypothetical protein
MGGRVEVSRADTGPATCKVPEMEQVDKQNFPTHKVYGATERPALRPPDRTGPTLGLTTPTPTQAGVKCTAAVSRPPRASSCPQPC